MATPISRACLFISGICIISLVAAAGLSRAPSAPPVSARVDSPKTIEQLRAIQTSVQDVIRQVMPATVAVYSNAGQGSGVIVSKDGYVLTAGHVVADPGSDAVIVLADGRKLRAKTLGIDRGSDAGMLKITDAGDWPFVERGESASLKQGQFTIALGNPSTEYRAGRPPAVRLGRLALSQEQILQTDCVMDHGDSGGPLFDLAGRLIGIHGSIGQRDSINVHIPIDVFSENWDRLKNGEAFGVRAVRGSMLGLAVDDDAGGCKITGVVEGSPADKAGFKAGDLLVKFGLADVKTQLDFLQRIIVCQPGDEIKLSIVREKKVMRIAVKLAAATTRPSRPATREQARESPTLKNAFRPALMAASRSVVRVRCQNKDAALGTIVSTDGFILTESTNLHESIACVVGGKTFIAKRLGEAREQHLAMLRINAQNLPAISWDDAINLPAGAWVAAPNPQGSAIFTGVISIGRERAVAVKPGATPVGADGQDHQPSLSPILQHDGNLQLLDCGGPLVNLDGKVVGMNIMRGSRTASYAIPADVILSLLDGLKSGKSAPAAAP